jgi:hypothetical protein
MYKKLKSAKLKNEALKRWCLSSIINAILIWSLCFSFASEQI